MTCQLDNNKFAVSVADALLFDDSCGGEQLILSAKTLINSSITQAIQATTIYGGKGSQSQFEFNYQKEITVALEDSVFSPVYMAVQNGTNIVNELAKFYTTEDVVFDAQGVGTLKGAPVGNIQVAMEDGTFMTVLATGGKVTVPAMANKTVALTFAEEGMHDTITIDAASFPKSLKLVLKVDIFDNNGLAEQMQIVIPKFKPDGALELALTHDGVATSALAGKALSACGEYAKIAFKKVSQSEKPCYVALVANPADVEFSVVDNNEPVAISVLGVRGGIYGNVTLDNTKLNWESSDDAVITVVDGVITLAPDVVAPQTATVTVTAEGAPPITIAVDVQA